MADALRRGLGKSAPELQPDFADSDGTHCFDCGSDLPPERIENERVRCAECQAQLEREIRMRAYNVTVQ